MISGCGKNREEHGGEKDLGEFGERQDGVEAESGDSQAWLHVSALPFRSCASLGQLCHLFVSKVSL